MSECLTRDAALVARGMRLRRIRRMASITSDELAKKVGVSRQSFSAWENAKQSGLSVKGAEATIRILKEAGIYCNFDWLLYGTGEEPYWLSEGISEQMVTTAYKNLYPEDIRSEEIKIFQQNYPNAVVMQVLHNAMNPIFREGDWIGGCWRTVSPRLLNEVCIVESGDYLEVRLLKGRSVEGYHLQFMSYSSEAKEPFELANQKVVKVAPVVRLWRKT